MSSSNATVSSEANTLNHIATEVLIWGLIICFIFGGFGFLTNIYVFTRTSLRENACSMYFLSSSIAGLIFLLASIPFRVLQYGFNIDPTYYLLGFCKTEYYITFSSRALTSWFLVLACADRYLCSSFNINYRRWSSVKVASRIIPLMILLVLITYIHVPIFYTINSFSPICAGQPGFYRIFLGVWHVVAYGSGPPCLMFLFSVLTLRNIKNRRIFPITSAPNQDQRNSEKNKNLLRMALVQCLCIGLTTSLFSISQLYILITSNEVISNLQSAKNNFFAALGGVISTAGHSATFYLYTATSKLFRQHLYCRRQAGL